MWPFTSPVPKDIPTCGDPAAAVELCGAFAGRTSQLVSSPSPFVTKVEAYLRFAGLPYKRKFAYPQQGPKGKMPWILHGSNVVPDSTFILRYLEATYGPLPAKLRSPPGTASTAQAATGSPEAPHGAGSAQRAAAAAGGVEAAPGVSELPHDEAVGLAVQRLVDDHLAMFIGYYRFVRPQGYNWTTKVLLAGVPFPLSFFLPVMLRRSVLARLTALTAHSAADVAYLMGQDLAALAALLGGRRFFGGAAPAAVDASVFGVLEQALHDGNYDSTMRDGVRRYPRLVAYVDDVRATFFADHLARSAGDVTSKVAKED